MKYSTLVLAALLGYAQAVTIRDDAAGTSSGDALDSENEPEARKRAAKKTVKAFPKFRGDDSSSDDSDSDNDFPWPQNQPARQVSKLDKDFNGKGVIYEGEAGAESH